MGDVILLILLSHFLEMQKPTKVYGRRAYGVGLLVAGYDVS